MVGKIDLKSTAPPKDEAAVFFWITDGSVSHGHSAHI